MLRRNLHLLAAVTAGAAAGSVSASTHTANKPHASKTPPAPAAPRIYTSPYPSILPQLHRERSLCDFMFRHWEAAAPESVAFIQAETKDRLTYPQLRAATERLAEILYHEYGIRKGDVVCLLMLNNIYYAPAVYAVMRLGAVVTTSNAITTPEALCPQLEHVRAKAIVSSRLFTPLVEGAAAAYKGATGRTLAPMYVEEVVARLRGGESAGAIPSSYTALQEATLDDTIFIPFSSGTTGAPKGVQLTNRAITANLLQGKQLMHNEKVTFLSVLPFFHIYGFTSVMCGPMLSQSRQVVMMKYNLDLYLQCLEEYKVKIVFLAPPIINSIVGRLELTGATLPHLGQMNNGAAPLAPENVNRMKKVAPNVRLTQGWGMTEMSPAVSGVPSPWGQYPTDDISPYSSGRLMPDTELRVVKVSDSQQSGEDASEGIDCEPGEMGELWTRGPQLMKGYTNPVETAKCIVDGGWYRTGDIGYMDPTNETVFVTDRLKELIKYKGFQVSPVQVEAEISKHPWVQDCVVVGVFDPRDVSYEVPRALVVLKGSLTPEERAKASDAIYDFIKQHCPPHKRLHGGVRIVDALMKSATGKVMRRQIRQAEIEYVKEHMDEEIFH